MENIKKDAIDDQRNFDSSIETLTTIIDELESDTIDLQGSLQAFEVAIGLARSAQKTLTEAEQKVMLLLGDGEESSTQDLPSGEGPE